MEKMIELLNQNGINPQEARKMVESIRNELGQFATRTISENIMEDLETGRITITRRAYEEYRKLFANAGMNINDHLQDKRTFLKAYRRANSVWFSAITEDFDELPFIRQ